ncbi:MAG: PIN domain-containing protein [Candidatus Thermoplasmatota archaeon]
MPNHAREPAKKPSKPTKGKGTTAAAPPKKKAPAPPKPHISPPPKEAVEDPLFVRMASPADRKAALEAVLHEEGVPKTVQQAITTPVATPPPIFVKESPAAIRKAAVEALAEESGVKSVLAKAPWKRGPPAPPTPPPPAPPVPGAPLLPRASPRVMMTQAPFETTTGKSAPKVVILDTNALMMQFQFHIDIEKEVNRILGGNYEVVVPSIVVDELHRIAKEQTGKDQGVARMAAELAKTFRIEDAPGDGDTGILKLAARLNAVVVTNDKRLRATLRAKDIPNIYMRSQAFLTLEGHLPGM